LKRDRGLFLDTTFILPFFGVNIDTPHAESLEKALVVFDELHVSEASLLEAKSKLQRVIIKDPSFEAAFFEFGEKLELLRGDERIKFHGYTASDDRFFNIIRGVSPRLDFFDHVILAQSISVGTLLTEDRVLLDLRKKPEFVSCREFGGFTIRRLGELLKEIA
jgi:hypothetical protein